MSTLNTTKALLRGGHFLLERSEKDQSFTPEDFSEEQQMVRDTARQFVLQDHFPLADRMENGEHILNRDLLERLGELGLLGSHMPEEYGGMNLDTNTSTIITEEI